MDRLMVDPMRTGCALGMHDAASCGHPVNLAGADRDRRAERVTVHDLAVEQLAHGREPDMRMWPHVEALAAAEFGRAEMVEEDEGPDHARASGGKRPADGKAVAEVGGAGDDDIGYGVAGIGVAGRRVCTGGKAHVGSSMVGRGNYLEARGRKRNLDSAGGRHVPPQGPAMSKTTHSSRASS